MSEIVKASLIGGSAMMFAIVIWILYRRAGTSRLEAAAIAAGAWVIYAASMKALLS